MNLMCLTSNIIEDIMSGYELSDLAAMNLNTLIKAKTLTNCLVKLENFKLKPVKYLIKKYFRPYTLSTDNDLYFKQRLIISGVDKVISYWNVKNLLILSNGKVYKVASGNLELLEEDVLALNEKYMIKEDEIIIFDKIDENELEIEIVEIIELDSPIVRTFESGFKGFRSSYRNPVTYAVNENDQVIIDNETKYSRDRLIADHGIFKIVNYPNVISIAPDSYFSVYFRTESAIIMANNEFIMYGKFSMMENGFNMDLFIGEYLFLIHDNIINYIRGRFNHTYVLSSKIIEMGQYSISDDYTERYWRYYILENGDFYIGLFDSEPFLADLSKGVISAQINNNNLWLLFDDGTIGFLSYQKISKVDSEIIVQSDVVFLPNYINVPNEYKQIKYSGRGLWFLNVNGDLIFNPLHTTDAIIRHIDLSYLDEFFITLDPELRIYKLKIIKIKFIENNSYELILGI